MEIGLPFLFPLPLLTWLIGVLLLERVLGGLRRLPERWELAGVKSPLPPQPQCSGCRYNLAGLPLIGVCPECGMSYDVDFPVYGGSRLRCNACRGSLDQAPPVGACPKCGFAYDKEVLEKQAPRAGNLVSLAAMAQFWAIMLLVASLVMTPLGFILVPMWFFGFVPSQRAMSAVRTRIVKSAADRIGWWSFLPLVIAWIGYCVLFFPLRHARHDEFFGGLGELIILFWCMAWLVAICPIAAAISVSKHLK